MNYMEQKKMNKGTKIIGKVNGAIGIVEETKIENGKEYVIIKWKNANPGQQKKSTTEVKHLKYLEKNGGVEIVERQSKTNTKRN